MVLPYFDYGDVLYLKSNTKLFNKLQTLQNRALGVCFGNRVLINTDEMHLQVTEWAFFGPPGGQETMYHLRVALTFYVSPPRTDKGFP